MPPRRWLLILAVLGALLLAGGGVSAAVPRSLDAGTTLVAAPWSIEASPRLLAPRFLVQHDDAEAAATGARWPGALQAEPVTFADELTGEPAFTAVVGSVPLRTDSVRITTRERGVRESTVRGVGWHRVHAAAFDGDVAITEVAAIGSGGEVIAVLDGDDLT